jgi:hypothetical protein
MSYAAIISEDDNIGSLREIKLAVAKQLTSINPITFKSGFGWDDIDFLPESGSNKDDSKDTANGTEYTYSLVFAFNRQNTALFNAFKKYLGQFGVLQFTDNNDFTRIIGTIANPVTITHSADTGQQYSSLNYYKVNVSWLSDVPALVV